MNFKKFGDPQNKIITLIHGSFMTWEMWDGLVRDLKEDYYVILPVLGGHDTEGPSEFVSIEQQAQKIADHIRENHGSRIFALIGFSLGGSIAAEIIAQGRLAVEKAIIDAGVFSPVLPLARRLSAGVIVRALAGIKRGRKGFKRLIAAVFSADAAECAYRVAVNMTKEDCKNVFTTCFGYRLAPQFKDTAADIVFWYGERENAFIKRSAKNIAAALPGVTVRPFKRLRHGELIERHPEIYLQEALAFLEGEK